ncbi:facilitated trehalose transporter Tret1-like [Portunus trituberculatus]|uniref:facilitated trehalose transporter Tret1-like n=1 Tax=Portunus trituberculatus TaxID=210409 RepID=UPI001E1CEFF8|nr:facilitated trehalose transporter Tret1-like [Portunus trituberculatus]
MEIAGNDCRDLQEEEMLQNKEQESRSARSFRVLKQLGFTIIASLGHFSTGSVLTWPSPALSDLARNNVTWVGTELVLTSMQVDMTGSLVSLGSILGVLMGGTMVTRLGRRRSMQTAVAPWLIGLVALALAPNVHVLLLARLLLGFTSGVSAVAGALYTTEIVDAEVRGIMYNILCLNVTLGGLFAVGVGYFVRWFHLAMICTIPPSLLLIGSFFLPDSPTLLVVRGEKIEALRVLRKLRGPHANLKSEIEVIEMKNSFRADGWQKLLNRYIVKRIIIVVMLMAFLFLCGNDVFIVHTARILREAGYPMDADIGTTTVAVVRIVGMLVSFLLVDRMGRRPSLVASYAISSVFLIVLGVYVHLTETATPEDTTSSALGWVPLVSVIMISFGLQIGAQPVTFLLSAEYFPTSVRGQTFSICYSSGMLCSFLVLQVYNLMVDAFTLSGYYWFCAAISFVAVIFTLIFVRETKGENVG